MSTPGSRELGERRCGQRLELRCADPLRGRAHAADRRLEVDIFLVDLDPLAPTRDMRRGVGADCETFSRQEGRCPSRRRRLSVRADDVDRG
jgi:hypothetical protein